MTQQARRRRLDPAERRREIIFIATQLISTRGYRAVSLNDIADACGMAKSGLMHHFPTKESLLVDILAERDREDLEFIAGHFPGPLDRDTCRSHLDKLVERNFARREIILLYTVLAAESLDLEHPTYGYFNHKAQWTRELFRTAAAGWHPEPDAVADLVYAFLDGLQSIWLRSPDIDPISLWHKFADAML
ncbi:TetR/AcrR family transcriptional regulator [Nocardia neocaledoniensis]|uniref:TetR/AcrR family transcriptional regulator n=1 Tax=Nocardia neocaledoniensis TaxID=236511 RepID=UPI002454A09B|nr:TetR/AcrR family transcriptional regulator [Nocardia neocaledoniensis]